MPLVPPTLGLSRFCPVRPGPLSRLPSPQTGTPARGAGLFGVACPLSGVCFTTGDYYDTGGDLLGLIETLSAGSWTATEAPVPLDAGADPQTQVWEPSCPSQDFVPCPAITSRRMGIPRGYSTRFGMAAGRPAKPQSPTTHRPVNPQAFFTRSRAAAFECVGVGKYTDSSGNTQGLIDFLYYPGGTVTPSKITGLIGNVGDKVSGSGWTKDTSVTLNSVLAPLTLPRPVTLRIR